MNTVLFGLPDQSVAALTEMDVSRFDARAFAEQLRTSPRLWVALLWSTLLWGVAIAQLRANDHGWDFFRAHHGLQHLCDQEASGLIGVIQLYGAHVAHAECPEDHPVVLRQLPA